MNNEQRRAELAQFLRTRRERLSPSQVHLPDGVRRRRTPGLRREELAQIADISPTWYTKLEQGQDIQVSVQVLESLSCALQLNSDERTYLFVMAREQLPLPRPTHVQQISTHLQYILDTFQPNPAIVTNERWDILGWNQSASQVFGYHSALSSWERNLLWLVFTEPDQRKLYVHWESVAQRMLALFRASKGRGIDTVSYNELRDQLMHASPEFRTWWLFHDVGEAHTGRKDLKHPLVGPLSLQLTGLHLADTPNISLFLYTPLDTDTAARLAQLTSPLSLG